MVGEEGECRVLYDDDMQERLTLPRERFRWLAPRARSAGATPALYVRPGCLLVCAERPSHSMPRSMGVPSLARGSCASGLMHSGTVPHTHLACE